MNTRGLNDKKKSLYLKEYSTVSLSFKKQIEEQTQVTFFRLKTKFKAPLKAASIGSIKILRNMTVKVYDKADQYQSEKNMLCKIILQLTHKAFPIQYRPSKTNSL